MKKIAVVSAILENPGETQGPFNEIVSRFKHVVKGRMGLPFEAEDMAVIAIAVAAPMDEINSFTGQLGKLPGVVVKTAVGKKELP